MYGECIIYVYEDYLQVIYKYIHISPLIGGGGGSRGGAPGPMSWGGPQAKREKNGVLWARQTR